ncbi:transcription elongation factor A N-terminal and central domain-containing protein isoform X1 [Oncorhynchus keta]|uniref:transcription elongation factor A N-terminal and central domain-containing protein isoform X1 n=2 Tax=Oncorhynchus keta TaxID=8018 RepID=UPI00227B0BBD|nr:transcription elongation factor A N-terminal and central domain-containing protein isoform X1 [Oncorhynchus keta]
MLQQVPVGHRKTKQIWRLTAQELQFDSSVSKNMTTMDIKQITHHALQMDKFNRAGNYGNIMPLLTALDNACVTCEQLQGTDIVRVLYRLLKTCSDNSVKKTAKHLLSKWKELYSHPYHISKENGSEEESTVIVESMLADKACLADRGGLAAGDASKPVELGVSCEHVVFHTGSEDRTLKNETKCGRAKGEGLSSWQAAGDSSSGSIFPTLSKQSEPPATTSLDTPPLCKDSSDLSLRTKCIQLLHGALDPETSKEAEGKTADLARVIEVHIHALHHANQAKYKACIRSKVTNLRNPKNGHLRCGLLGGSLGPEVFARMSLEEMANEELQRLREEYSSQGVSERQLPQGVEGTPTQKLRCRRCDGSDCRVTQVSRGTLFLPAWVRQATADQDAMTFVTCSRCGEQWYHSGWVCL